MEFLLKERYTLADLREIMRLLRTPAGCPWDREQTHRSIASNLLEEAYEAADAIERADTDGLREELGDVLLQVVFHAQMASEAGTFDFDDVADEICKKLIVRHPHVFGTAQAGSAAEVLRQWDAIKRATKGDKPQREIMKGLPAAMPALMRAQKVLDRAGRVGYTQDGADAPLSEGELGEALLLLAGRARASGLDAETTLRGAVDAFIAGFEG